MRFMFHSVALGSWILFWGWAGLHQEHEHRWYIWCGNSWGNLVTPWYTTTLFYGPCKKDTKKYIYIYMSYSYGSCWYDENCSRFRWSKMCCVCSFCMLIFYGSPFRKGKIGWESESIELWKLNANLRCVFWVCYFKILFHNLVCKG